MNAATLESIGRSQTFEDYRESTPRRLARVSGLLYLVLFLFGMFSPLVLEALVTPDDAAATAETVSESFGLFGISLVTWSVIIAADIAISVTLYMLLEPVGRALSMVTAAFRLVYSALLGAFLFKLFEAFALFNSVEGLAGPEAQGVQDRALAAVNSFSDGFVLALMFFGIHLVLLGVLFHRSGYVPRILGILLAVAGIGYVADGLASFFWSGHSDAVSIVLLMPALVGELGLTAWLLLKEVKVPNARAPRAN